MGISYRASVFVGTFAPVKSRIGQLLEAMVDEYGGTLCPIQGHPLVGIDIVGDNMGGGGMWATVQLRNPSVCYDGRGFDITAPCALEPQDVTAIKSALESIGIDPETMPTIGWYFASSVA